MGGEAGFLLKLLSELGRSGFPPPPPARINWPHFTVLVKKNRLSSLFYYHFRSANGKIALPEPVWRNLREEYHLLLARSVLRTNYINEVLTIFPAEGIEAILLKGAHLAEAYYPHPALRPFDDVDLLIRPPRAKLARSLLGQRGYRSLEETESAQKLYLLKAQKQGGFFLELHTDLQTPQRKNPSFNIRISDFWKESAPFLYRGVPVRVLQPTRNLFYLACHLCHHGFSRLIWLYDLHLVISKSGGEINWEELVREARRSRSAALVYYPLKFARELLNSPVPKNVLTSLAPPVYKKFAASFFLRRSRLATGKAAGGRRAASALRLLLNDSWPEALKSYILG